ncbi:protein FAM65A [Elysia marginata]|uniref:Protein FAM65A n=1 Tax=Elysia marginata TaxID=1093978 RepID=A0AAV4FWM5_9GAST|nr:protein FAM65A [Elysia marginata]
MGNEEDLDWLKSVLSREMEVNDEGKLFRFELMAFCNIEGEYYGMWERVNIQASESWAMKEVFDMNSSVRVDAIENLGKFRTAAVIDALRDLLSDEDANARAVAAVSLARTDANDPVTVKFLMKTLNDKDRLVREAGCLALGHLQARQAVNKLLHMWRNDVISHVREAANVALNQIGGPEVEKAMRVTKVLADEIRQLTSS